MKCLGACPADPWRISSGSRLPTARDPCASPTKSGSKPAPEAPCYPHSAGQDARKNGLSASDGASSQRSLKRERRSSGLPLSSFRTQQSSARRPARVLAGERTLGPVRAGPETPPDDDRRSDVQPAATADRSLGAAPVWQRRAPSVCCGLPTPSAKARRPDSQGRPSPGYPGLRAPRRPTLGCRWLLRRS